MNFLNHLLYLIPFVLIWAFWRDYLTDKWRIENEAFRAQIEVYQNNFAARLNETLRQWSMSKSFKDDLNSLTRIQQDRMNRCQNEQFWSLGAYYAITGFIISNRSSWQNDAAREIAAFSAIAGLGVWLGIFLCDRHVNYYRHRHSFNILADHYPHAPQYMRIGVGVPHDTAVQSGLRSTQSVIWIIAFAVATILPPTALWLIWNAGPTAAATPKLTG